MYYLISITFINQTVISTTHAKNHFGGGSRVSIVWYFGSTKSSDFVYFDRTEYFVIFNE